MASSVEEKEELYRGRHFKDEENLKKDIVNHILIYKSTISRKSKKTTDGKVRHM